MRDCKKCQNDTFGVRKKCHFLIQIEESEIIFLIEMPKKRKTKQIITQNERMAE